MCLGSGALYAGTHARTHAHTSMHIGQTGRFDGTMQKQRRGLLLVLPGLRSSGEVTARSLFP